MLCHVPGAHQSNCSTRYVGRVGVKSGGLGGWREGITCTELVLLFGAHQCYLYESECCARSLSTYLMVCSEGQSDRLKV